MLRLPSKPLMLFTVFITCLFTGLFWGCDLDTDTTINPDDSDEYVIDRDDENLPPADEQYLHHCPDGDKVRDRCFDKSDCARNWLCGPAPVGFTYECTSGVCQIVEDVDPSDVDFDDDSEDFEFICDEANLCTTEGVNTCTYDEAEKSCIQVGCVDGCLRTIHQTIGDQVGYCEGGEQGGCVVCDSYQNGLYYGCRNPSDDKVDPVTPNDQEGFLSYEGPRGQLIPDQEWSELLKPGERRLSSFGMADGLEPHDMHGDLVTWCYGQYGFVYVYNIATNWIQEIRIEAFPHLCWWVSTDGEKVFVVTSRPDSNTATDIVIIDPAVGTWWKLDEFTQNATIVSEIHARNGRVVWSHGSRTKKDQIASLNLQTGFFNLITDRPDVQFTPRLFQNTAVWAEHSSTGHSQILSYDFANGQLAIVDSATEEDRRDRAYPMAFDDHIAWFASDYILSLQTKQYEIFLHTLSTNQTEMIPTTGIVADPYGDDDLLAWGELMEGHTTSIRFMKLETEEQFWLDDPAWTGRRSDPLLAGRWLVYLEANRFPKPGDFPLGYDVILYDLCEHEEIQDTARCQPDGE